MPMDAAALDRAIAATPNAYAQMVQSAAPVASPAGIGVGPYLALAGGEGADLGTTLAAISSGRGREANPLLSGGTPQLVATKVGTAVALAYLIHKLAADGHPLAAKILGYGAGAGYGALAAHNATVGR